jgi:succinylglutamate desuccinylase
MEVTVKGPGEPEIGVIYCTHGNETAGKEAVEKLLREEPGFRKAVKFVFANEKAFQQGERFIDTDLNRSFPGDPESESYEERLAARLVQELQGLNNLDLHETVSEPVPFALFTNKDQETLDALGSTGVGKAVEISYTPGCGVNSYGGVEVETGPRGTEESVEMAYRVLERFLVNQGALEGEKRFSEPEIYSVYSEVDRPEGDWETCVENFEKIGEGDEIAASESGEQVFSSESFTPVLFSESYPEIFGFKAVRLEKVEERIYSRRGE